MLIINSNSTDGYTMYNRETISTVQLEKIAKAYDSPPWWYDIRGFFILTFAYRGTLWEQVSLFGKNMGNNHLEAAIGTGTLLNIILHWNKLLRKPDSNITGFDYAEPMLDGARHRFAKWKNIRLLHADVGNLPLPDASFDTVNIANSIHCFPDITKAFSEIHRILKPGGTLAGNVLIYPKGNSLLDRISNRINNWGIKKGILVTPYKLPDIQQRITAAGFALRTEHYHGNIYNFTAQKA